MMNAVKLGLVGCGGIVQKSHLQGLLSCPEWVQVTAISDVVPENLMRIGTAADVPSNRRYADYREMLEKADLDAVTIATPHHMHAEHVMTAVEAGVSVISEKPMAMSLEEADQILGAVERVGVSYSVVHNFLFTPGVQIALKGLEGMGKTLYGRAKSLFNKTEDQADPESVWRASKEAGGGCINDSAYHEIYLVENLVGSPVKYVEARVKTVYFDFDVDDLALLLMEHENGAVSTVSTSWCVPGSGGGEMGNLVEVHAKGGGFRVIKRGQELQRYLREKRKWEAVDLVQFEGVEPEVRSRIGHAGYFAATFEALAKGEALPVTGKQARHNLAIIDAARRATEERRAMEV